MQFINRAEITGRVGSVRIHEQNGLKVAHLTVATELAYKSADGLVYFDVDWHYVTARNGSGIADLDTIQRLDWVHVTGRMRTRAYANGNGAEGRMTEILAHELKILPRHE